MRIVAAECSAIYTGRGDTQLGRAVRAIMIKEDGTVSIHNDKGIKPLNYMRTATMTETLEEGLLVWTFDQRRESLRIEIYQVFSDVNIPLVIEDEGLIRDGTEPHLQEWLAKNLNSLSTPHLTTEEEVRDSLPLVLSEEEEEEQDISYELIQREFPTGDGPVDLFVKDSTGQHWAVEVKRVAILSAVYQVKRYVDALNSPSMKTAKEEDLFTSEDSSEAVDTSEESATSDYGEVKGMLVALDIRPKAAELASKRGIRLVTLPDNWRQGDIGETTE